MYHSGEPRISHFLLPVSTTVNRQPLTARLNSLTASSNSLAFQWSPIFSLTLAVSATNEMQDTNQSLWTHELHPGLTMSPCTCICMYLLYIAPPFGIPSLQKLHHRGSPADQQMISLWQKSLDQMIIERTNHFFKCLLPGYRVGIWRFRDGLAGWIAVVSWYERGLASERGVSQVGNPNIDRQKLGWGLRPFSWKTMTMRCRHGHGNKNIGVF